MKNILPRSTGKPPCRSRTQQRVRLRCEPLENRVVPAEISGTLTEINSAGSLPIANATVNVILSDLSGGFQEVVTGADGRFRFTVSDGEYRVSMKAPGSLIASADGTPGQFVSSSVAVEGFNVTVDRAFIRNQATIRGRLWEDLNDNGLQDINEPDITIFAPNGTPPDNKSLYAINAFKGTPAVPLGNIRFESGGKHLPDGTVEFTIGDASQNLAAQPWFIVTGTSNAYRFAAHNAGDDSVDSDFDAGIAITPAIQQALSFFAPRTAVISGLNLTPGAVFDFDVGWVRDLPAIEVNDVRDLQDASPNDAVADVDLQTAGLQTTLRAALQEAQRRISSTTITFAIRNPQGTLLNRPAIPIGAALPIVTKAITLDASTQPGGVTVSGKNGNARVDADGLSFAPSAAATVRIRDLHVTGFGRDGVAFAGNVVQPSTRLELFGVAVTDNLGFGVDSVARAVLIDRAVVHTNGQGGVFLQGDGIATNDIVVTNSTFGSDVDIGELTPSENVGLTLSSLNGVRIGGANAGDGNRFYRHWHHGILATDVRNLQIAGNFIGVSPAGRTSGNFFSGLVLAGVSNSIIGGITEAERNTIGDNSRHGIDIQNLIRPTQIIRSHDIAILGNLIGVDRNETIMAGNDGGDGIHIEEATDIQIGGVSGPSAGNVIANSRRDGIRIVGPATGVVGSDPTSMRIKIQGNYIGRARITPFNFGNGGSGIRIINSSDNAVGWQMGSNISVDDAVNIIANNKGDGITVEGDDSKRNSILVNSFDRNGVNPFSDLQIDLGNDGPDSPDALDEDAGPNQLQNRPTLFLRDEPVTQVSGELRAAANQTYRLEFFANQGQRFLAAQDITTGSNGVAAFVQPIQASDVGVRATATDAEGNTSEFNGVVVFVNSTGDEPDIAGDDVADIDLGKPGLQTTLRAALDFLRERTDDGEIRAAIPTDDPGYDAAEGVFVVTPRTALPRALANLVLDGFNELGGGRLLIDGRNAGASMHGLNFNSARATIRNTIIEGFGGDGLHAPDSTLTLESVSSSRNIGHGAMANQLIVDGTGNTFADNRGAGLKAIQSVVARQFVALENNVGIEANTVELLGDYNAILDNNEDGIRTYSNVTIDGVVIADQKLGDGINAGGHVLIRNWAEIVRNGRSLADARFFDGHGIQAAGRVEANNLIASHNHGAGVNIESQFVGEQRIANAFLHNATLENNGHWGLIARRVDVRQALITGNNADGIFAQEEIVLTDADVLGNQLAGIRGFGSFQYRNGTICGNAGGNIVVTGAVMLDNVANCDIDLDGISDELENTGPNGGDGNADGVADGQQGNVATVRTVSGGFATLVATGGQPLIGVQAVGNPAPESSPPGVAFPVGFFGFMVTTGTLGGPVTVQIELPEASGQNSYWMYAASPGNPSPHWWNFTFDGVTGAEILENGSRVVLHFIDGGRGDADGAANGVIVDPGAPAITTNLAPNLQVTGPSIAVSGQPLAFTFTATDPDHLAGDTFNYRIDWNGDGQFDESITNAPASLIVPHVFDHVGNPTIRVTVSDSDNNESDPTTAGITIQRTVLSGGVLIVGGTPGNDNVTLRRGIRPGRMQVLLQRKVAGTFLGVTQIIVFAGAGNDSITSQTGLRLPCEFHGGAGNDILTGGPRGDRLFGDDGADRIFGHSGNDFLDGGAGNDILFGGLGRDILLGQTGNDALYSGGQPSVMIGGQGADRLFGNQDLLIGEATSFDQDKPGLQALLAAWADPNSSLHKTPGLWLRIGETVFDDAMLDALIDAGGK